MLVQKILCVALLASGMVLSAGCHDDFEYGYLTPPVTVTSNSDSGAHYGPSYNRSGSDAHYGPSANNSRSDVHYGRSDRLPPVSVDNDDDSDSDAHYG